MMPPPFLQLDIATPSGYGARARTPSAPAERPAYHPLRPAVRRIRQGHIGRLKPPPAGPWDARTFALTLFAEAQDHPGRRLGLAQPSRLLQHLLRHPARERSDPDPMVPSDCMLLANGGQSPLRQPARQPNQGRPQTPMHERDPAVQKPAHEHLLRVAHRSGHPVHVTRFRVTPPASQDRPARDRLGQARHRTLARHQHDSVLPDEDQRLSSAQRCAHAIRRDRQEMRGALASFRRTGTMKPMLQWDVPSVTRPARSAYTQLRCRTIPASSRRRPVRPRPARTLAATRGPRTSVTHPAGNRPGTSPSRLPSLARTL